MGGGGRSGGGGGRSGLRMAASWLGARVAKGAACKEGKEGAYSQTLETGRPAPHSRVTRPGPRPPRGAAPLSTLGGGKCCAMGVEAPPSGKKFPWYHSNPPRARAGSACGQLRNHRAPAPGARGRGPLRVQRVPVRNAVAVCRTGRPPQRRWQTCGAREGSDAAASAAAAASAGAAAAARARGRARAAVARMPALRAQVDCAGV